MKKLILSIIIVFLALLAFSQATVETGHVDKHGSLFFDKKSSFKNDFLWIIDDTLITCHIYEVDTIVEMLAWKIREAIPGDLTDRYLVSNYSEKDFILDFKNEGKSVIILNEQTKSFSIMEGEGVYY
jgi:hypothetical protein